MSRSSFQPLPDLLCINFTPGTEDLFSFLGILCSRKSPLLTAVFHLGETL